MSSDDARQSLARYVLRYGPAQFKGRSLSEISRTDEGLLYLERTLDWKPQYETDAVKEGKQKIAEFLNHPEMQSALKLARARSKQSRRHKPTHADRERQAEYGM
jgi:hypothetical protein